MRAESECLLKTEVAALTRYYLVNCCDFSGITNCNDSVHRYRHPNLIALMDYCTSKPILVYPYMQRESLFKNLHEWKV